MKNKLATIATVTVLVFSVSPVFGNETAAVWSRIYNTTYDMDAKLDVMQNMVNLHDRDMAPVLTEALREIVYSIDESRTFNEQKLYDDLSRIIVFELGSLKTADAAPEIYRVMRDTEDEFLRATAITSLGSAGARDYADEIAEYLRYINSDIIRIENNEQRESVVDACVFALERLKHPEGFEPVFFTSIGRYSRESIKKAERALMNMIEDPTDLILDIIRADNTFEVRLTALGVEERSRADASRMTEAAIAAIEVGLLYNADTPAERQYQARSRLKACEMIRDLSVADESAVEWLGLMLNRSEAVDEQLTCLQALGTYSSDSAVEVLTGYLVYHNQRRADGIQYKDERTIRECINALGASGNPNANSALMMVEYSNWSNQTIRMAKNALKNIQ